MLHNYLKLALRNLWKRRFSTAINVAGLAIGLACCALMCLFFQHELSFDKGFDRSSDIYRITSTFKDGSGAPTVAIPYSKYLKTEIPEIEEVSRLDASVGNNILQVKGDASATPYLEQKGYWVDPTFFKVFSFHFLYGVRQTALSNPNTIVLSQPLAEKLFGKKDPTGKALRVDNQYGNQTYTVTGVFKRDFTSHFNPRFFASNNSSGIREHYAAVKSWVTDDNYYLYIRLRHGADPAKVNKELIAYDQNHAGDEMKASGLTIANKLQPLKDIYLHSGQYQDYIEHGDLNYLYLLGCITLAVLLLGCINFINLSTAQAIDRAREVGVRRVMGADRRQIRVQFLVETAIISLFALFLGLLAAFLLVPVFNDITGRQLSFAAPENRTLLLWMLMITLITGLLAGIYPAFYLSSFKPVVVLKGQTVDRTPAINARAIMVVVQFAVSMCLVFGSLVIWRQMDFMINTRPGFDQDQQVVIDLHSDQARKNSGLMIRELIGNAFIASAAGGAGPLYSGDMMFYPSSRTINDKHDVYLDLVDGNYLNTLGLKLIAGTNFTQPSFKGSGGADLEKNNISREIILNEEAVKILGFDPEHAIGQYVNHLHEGETYRYKIVGVVKNYHFFSLHALITPGALLMADPSAFTVLIVKVRGKHLPQAMDFIGKKWRQINPDSPLTSNFLDDVFRWDYINDLREQQLVALFTAIAILISSLGLLGLITYSLSQKIKEIAIRKVIGASTANIVALFSVKYLKLVLISTVLSWPLAWYFMSSWLNGFPYRIEIPWWVFMLSLITGLLVAFATISLKTFKAAGIDPVKNLKSE
jgi:putative ABC transport system permease protein